MTAAGLAPESPPPGVKRIVSVSLGSAARDHAVEVTMLGQQLRIERIGVDGDFQRACALIRELDGKVDAIGLGGTDLYVVAGHRRYVIRESAALAKCAQTTPVVDGSGLKHTLERETIRRLAQDASFDLPHKRVLLVCAVDRFGMAEAFSEIGCEIIFGDLMFGLGLPVPLRTLRGVRTMARIALPVFCRLPISYLYPTGNAQNKIVPRHGKFYAWAEVIAGDFLFIKKHLPAPGTPPPLAGKTILTNTVTATDVELLRERGVAWLITTTPELQGRSFGTNVMEATLVALSGRRPDDLTPGDYLAQLDQLRWQPRVEALSPRV